MTLTEFINPVVPLNLRFPRQRFICPHSRLSAKYRIVTNNFTNDDLTDGNSPSYQSLVNISPALLRSATEETPVPTTRTLSSMPVPPAEPAPFSISTLKPRAPSVKTFYFINLDLKVGVRSSTFPSLTSLGGSFRGSARERKVLGRAPTCRSGSIN